MRIAVVSDIHGNLTAFEAVLADLRETAPDLIFHGGDLAHGGASPAEIVDRVRDLCWPGVLGNTDEMLFRPEALEEFAGKSSAPDSLWAAIRQMAEATRNRLGEERTAWLRQLPRVQVHSAMALVHASPESTWVAPEPEASDAQLESVYGPLDRSIVVYGHIHRGYVREVVSANGQRLVVNAGSVSLSYDGDYRASYLLLDGQNATLRRVAYDLEKEVKALSTSGLPHADWIADMLSTGKPQMPKPNLSG